MRRLAKPWTVLAIVGLLTALAVACGGGGESEGEGSPTPSPTGEDAALAPCNALQALKTYRYTVNLELELTEPLETPGAPQPTPTTTLTQLYSKPFLFEYEIDASFVAPDRFRAVITVAGQNPLNIINVGEQAWVELRDRWRLAEGQNVPYRPLNVCEAVMPDLDFSQAKPQEEKINDVKALHYTFYQATSEQAMSKIFGPGSDMDTLIKTLDADIWLAEKDNYPVRMDIYGSGFYADGRELRAHLVIDIKDANSDDIQVEPPL